jgi:hypothetical protein
MRQRFAIIITITAVVVLLIALNTASYVSKEKAPDTELEPDRSTFNAGATGTLALYDLLAESGRQVMRWRESSNTLLDADGNDSPSTFVITGKTRVSFATDEVKSLLRWVERGGRLVIVDRRPDARLLPSSEEWTLSTTPERLLASDVRASNTAEMTAGVALVRATQPSVLTRNVEAIQPSRFASAINISTTNSAKPITQASPTPSTDEDEEETDEDQPPPPALPPPATSAAPPKSVYVNRRLNSPAPVAHFEDRRGALLVDYPHGAGRIIILSDPFIIANNGLRLADNLQLAINAVAGNQGLIAFDEYHQGRAAARNQVLAYFSGTPVIWMLAQGVLIVLVILWTRGKRFARPLPVARIDRRSSLEFVASMAELQQRARAYDLAIENIYTRLRRVLVRYAGLGHNSARSEIAARVAARSGKKINAARLETLMRECEDAINGAPIDTNKTLDLVRQLRMVERTLGLRTRSREARQAAEGLRQNTV